MSRTGAADTQASEFEESFILIFCKGTSGTIQIATLPYLFDASFIGEFCTSIRNVIARGSRFTGDRTSTLSADFVRMPSLDSAAQRRMAEVVLELLATYDDAHSTNHAAHRTDRSLDFTLDLPETTTAAGLHRCICNITTYLPFMSMLWLRLPSTLAWERGPPLFPDASAGELTTLAINLAELPSPNNFHEFPWWWFRVAPSLHTLRLHGVVLPPLDTLRLRAAPRCTSVTVLHYRLCHVFQLNQLGATLAYYFPALEGIALTLSHGDEPASVTERDITLIRDPVRWRLQLFNPAASSDPRAPVVIQERGWYHGDGNPVLYALGVHEGSGQLLGRERPPKGVCILIPARAPPIVPFEMVLHELQMEPFCWWDLSIYTYYLRY